MFKSRACSASFLIVKVIALWSTFANVSTHSIDSRYALACAIRRGFVLAPNKRNLRGICTARPGVREFFWMRVQVDIRPRRER
jgi:hypothetical protein